MLKKCTSLVLSSAIICSAALADVDASTKANTYVVKNAIQYENPVTKVIEDKKLKPTDKGYQEVKKQGLSSINTILGTYSLVSENDGKRYITIRIGNTDINKDYKLSIKSPKDKTFKNVKYIIVKTDKVNKTVDLKMMIPSLDTTLRVSANVNGKNMVFFTKFTKDSKLNVKSFSSQKINVVKTKQAINKTNVTTNTDVTKKEEVANKTKVEEIVKEQNKQEQKVQEKQELTTPKAEEAKEENIDIQNLKDGVYKVQVEMFKSNGSDEPSEKSMANDALEKTALLKVKDKKATLTITMKPMALAGFGDKKGHLTSAWYYETKEEYIEHLRNPQDVSRLKATSFSQTYTDVDFLTDEKRQFPKNVIFPVKIGEMYSYIKVDIDAMPTARPDAAVYIKWNSITR